tara:strand:- start:34634 stop:35686 length:1053 start_codon:yes stop_codon:yes gene_type:complete
VARANPVGLDGFEFVEFCTPDFAVLDGQFKAMGFTPIAKHRSKAITLYRQGQINFLINVEPGSHAEAFANAHGPAACAMAFRVKDADAALAYVVERGAETVMDADLSLPAIQGVGGSVLYLVDRYGDETIYDEAFDYFSDADKHPRGVGLTYIDHLTHNLHQGNMDQWASYYETLFNFQEIRFFDIKGEHTGLVSRAMACPDNRIRIPLNESTDEQSQIEEFIRDFNGEGIQHIALGTDNIYETVEAMRDNQLTFMDVPDTYYEMIDDRVPGHGEDLERMHRNYILIDGNTKESQKRLLLQIFTDTMLGPVFFEIIQRKGDEGFGEGNFQALFESIERDQIRRGVIQSDK